MDIPEDVWKAAEAAQGAAMARCKAANFAVYEYPFNTGRAKDVLDDEIARAILAERERCAKVAEGFFTERYVEFGNFSDRESGELVAAAIRLPAFSPSLKEQEEGN